MAAEPRVHCTAGLCAIPVAVEKPLGKKLYLVTSVGRNKILAMQPVVMTLSSPAIRKSICSREYWTAARCYRISVAFGIMAAIILIVLGVLMISPAVDGLSLEPATCTVVGSGVDGSKSCGCGRYCTSSYPCLKIHVNYFPKDKPAKNVTNKLFHETVYENNDDKGCSLAPCEKSEENNYAKVQQFKESKGVIGQTYTCYYNTKKPDEVIAITGNFQMVVLHCILWPSLIILFSVGWTLLVYYRQRTCCGPKDEQNLNLIWE